MLFPFGSSSPCFLFFLVILLPMRVRRRLFVNLILLFVGYFIGWMVGWLDGWFAVSFYLFASSF